VDAFANEATTTLNGAVLAGATSMVVTSATGFPATAPYLARVSGTLTAGGTGVEYVRVTAGAGTTTWTVARGVEAPYSTGLGFATAAKVEAVFTAAQLSALGGRFVSVKDPQYGAKGDNATSDTAAINAAITAANAAGGGVVFMPPGTYYNTGTIAMKANVVLLGSGRQATVIRCAAAATVGVSIYGTDTANHLYYAGIEHLTLDGDDGTGTILDVAYASEVHLRALYIHNNQGYGMDLVEVWDSTFFDLFLEFTGGTTAGVSSLRVIDSRAASGFGAGNDSSNELYFKNLHIEHFRGGAIKVEHGPGTGGNNGIYFDTVKVETAFLVQGSTAIEVQQQTARIHLKNVYMYLAAFLTGTTVATGIKMNSAGQSSLRDCFIGNDAVATIGAAVDLANGSAQSCVIDNVTGGYGTAPTVAHLRRTSGSGYVVNNVNANLGTLSTGLEDVQNPALKSTAEAFRSISANQTTTSTAAVDLTNFVFQVESGATYILEVNFINQSSITTAGPRYAIGGTGSVAAAVGGWLRMWTSTSAAVNTMITATGASTGTNVGTATTSFVTEGRFRIVPSAAGALAIRWNMSAAGTATLVAGSYARLTRVGAV
jgi:hypothetical protein